MSRRRLLLARVLLIDGFCVGVAAIATLVPSTSAALVLVSLMLIFSGLVAADTSDAGRR